MRNKQGVFTSDQVLLYSFCSTFTAVLGLWYWVPGPTLIAELPHSHSMLIEGCHCLAAPQTRTTAGTRISLSHGATVVADVLLGGGGRVFMHT